MKSVIIFGTGKIAEVVLHCLRHASNFEVAACTVDREYLPTDDWHNLDCVAFENVEQHYPPSDFDMFVAMGYHDLNELRATKIREAQAKGYHLVSYIHPESGLPSDCQPGPNCFVMNNVNIHPCVSLGENVFVWSGAMIGHHSRIGDHCWLSSSTNISGGVNVGDNCFFAVNATVGHSVRIGNRCFLGANSLVPRCTEDEQVFVVESTKPFRLNSRQFLRLSGFASL